MARQLRMSVFRPCCRARVAGCPRCWSSCEKCRCTKRLRCRVQSKSASLVVECEHERTMTLNTSGRRHGTTRRRFKATTYVSRLFADEFAEFVLTRVACRKCVSCATGRRCCVLLGYKTPFAMSRVVASRSRRHSKAIRRSRCAPARLLAPDAQCWACPSAAPYWTTLRCCPLLPYLRAFNKLSARLLPLAR